MKKILLSLLTGALLGTATAQSFEFHDQSNNNITGTTQVFNLLDTDWDIDTYIKVKNISGTAKDIKIQRVEISPVATTVNYFCWYQCYSPMTAGTNPIYPMASDLAYADYVSANANAYAVNQVIFYFRPMGTTGISKFKVIAFDGNNPTDTATITLQFNVTTVGISEKTIAPIATLFPNPASDRATFSFEAQTSVTRNLVLHDVIGNKVAEYVLNGHSGNQTMDLSELKQGVYFCSLMENGKAVLTKRLVVTR